MRVALLTCLAPAIALVLFASPATAGTIYLYEGDPYTVIHNDPSGFGGAYDDTMRVEGWIELLEPLAPETLYYFWAQNGEYLSPGLLDYSFSDGLAVIQDYESYFHLQTDAAGAIAWWSVWLIGYAESPNPQDLLETQIAFGSDGGTIAIANAWHADDYLQYASTTTPGRWVRSDTIAVPEPSTLCLLALGALVFAWCRRRGPLTAAT